MTNLGSVKFVFIFETHFDIISPSNTEFLLSDLKIITHLNAQNV